MTQSDEGSFEKLRHKRRGVTPAKPNSLVRFERIDGCRKRAYRRRADAVKASKRSSVVLRVYVCPKCGLHHLTSDKEAP